LCVYVGCGGGRYDVSDQSRSVKLINIINKKHWGSTRCEEGLQPANVVLLMMHICHVGPVSVDMMSYWGQHIKSQKL